MRRTFALASMAALVATAAVASVVACSSDGAALNPTPTNDGAPPADAFVARDACGSTGCTGGDSGDDAGFDDDGAVVGAGCVLDTDCADGGRCGYSTLAACAATGICVTPDVPLADGAPLVACGCDGVDVSYVTSDLTSAPAASLAPCADAGPSGDAGAAPSEASTDAGDDASD
jgi:hypothetical protein